MVMQASEMLVYKLPPHLQNQTHVAISPIRDKQPSWVTPKVLEVSDGMVNIQNETSFPVKLNKNEAFADVVDMITMEEELEELGQINKVLKDSRDHSHLYQTKPLKIRSEYLDQSE